MFVSVAYRRQVATLRQEVMELMQGAVSVVVRAMVRQALGGNVAAARLLMQYGLGRPIEVPLPDDDDERDSDEGTVNKRSETEPAPAVVVGESAATKPAAAESGPVNKRSETESAQPRSAGVLPELAELESYLRGLHREDDRRRGMTFVAGESSSGQNDQAAGAGTREGVSERVPSARDSSRSRRFRGGT
ncbi:MAG: hypothetical protein U0840_17375 [Gemmataceae bacterium]